MAKTPYSKTDKVIEYLTKKLTALFSRVFTFDELNVIQVSHEIYETAYRLIEQEAVRLAQLVYKKYRRPTEEDKQGSLDALAFVVAQAEAYNPVTKYVFKNELERKRSRFAEGTIASDTPEVEIARSKRLLFAVVAQFLDDLTFAATIKALKDSGVTAVRWITYADGRRCKACAERHNMIYPIDDIPPKPHIHCRCWIEEV